MSSMVNSIFSVTIGMMVFSFLFFVVIAVLFFRTIRKHMKRNDNAPRITVPARVVAKRADISGDHFHGTVNSHIHSTMDTFYYVTFELDSRDRMELYVQDHEYGLLIEGDQGLLTFRGDAFIDFRRN
jgi:hypothetical protein